MDEATIWDHNNAWIKLEFLCIYICINQQSHGFLEIVYR